MSPWQLWWIRGFCEPLVITQQDVVWNGSRLRHWQAKLLTSLPLADLLCISVYFHSPLVCIWLSALTGHNRCLGLIMVCAQLSPLKPKALLSSIRTRDLPREDNGYFTALQMLENILLKVITWNSLFWHENQNARHQLFWGKSAPPD